MRVFFDVGFQSNGVGRVALQLAKYLPADCEIATGPETADLTILHVVGRHDHTARAVRRIKEQGHDYAIIQYVLESCRNPRPRDWQAIWDGARVVWSYYDLKQFIPGQYHAPLASDPEVFSPMEAEKKYIIGENGENYKAESLAEVRMAAFGLGRVLHVGPEFAADPNVTALHNITDLQFRQAYNECQRFAALRRKDGFEIIAVESLLCGVRPVMFDAPRYRCWFDGLAEFIPEGSPAEVVLNMKRLLKNSSNPVTGDEIEETKSRFNWERIIRGFWERCHG